LGSVTSCGEFMSATNLYELEKGYLTVSHETTGTVLADTSGQIAAGEALALAPVEVPQGQAALHATLNWPGSKLDLQLRDPTGRLVDPSYPNATLFADERPVHLIVANPPPGAWQATVVGVDVPRAQEPFTAIFSS